MALINKNHPILDVEEVESALKVVDQAIRELSDNLIGVGVDHINKIVGDLSDYDIYHLRDNIMYRVHSIRFHLVLLLRTRQHNEVKIHSGHPHKAILMNAQRDEQMAVFESIVFHSCSLFDYLGNIVDYVAAGHKRKKLQWRGAAKAARDKNNPLHNSPLATTIDKHSRQWIDKLYDYRSDLIHFKSDPCDVIYTHTGRDGKHEIIVFAPSRFVKSIAVLREKSKTHKLSLLFAAFWLVEYSTNSTLDIIGDLREHMEMNRRVKEEDQLFR